MGKIKIFLKKAIVFITVFSCVFSLLPINVSSKEETDYLRGTVNLIYDYPETTRLEVGSIKVMPFSKALNLLNLVYSVSGIDTKGSRLFLNDTDIGALSAEGALQLTDDVLKEGQNELKIVLITNSGKLYNDSLVYGTYNLDDVKLNSLSLTDVKGNTIPLTLVKYLPVTGSAGVNETTESYEKAVLDIGDGWNASTGLGGTTPNVPVMVGFRFNYKSEEVGGGMVYEVDTTLLPEGKNIVRFYDTENETYYNSEEFITVNNKAPEVEFYFANNEAIEVNDSKTVVVKDSISGVKSAVLYIDGIKKKEIKKAGEFAFSTYNLSLGRHTAMVITTDNAGNTGYFFGFFTVCQNKIEPIIIDNELNEFDGYTYYGVKVPKTINMYVNPMGDIENKNLRNSYEELVDITKLGKITTTAMGNTVPYQSFVVDVSAYSGTKAVISCSAVTGDYMPYIAAAWNYNNEKWEIIGRAQSGEKLSVEVNANSYTKDGKMRINIYPDISGNGSDTILWFTDTQYYTRYDDLNFLYQSIMEYAKSEYEKGNIAYVAFTGDFIDQMNTDAEADREYKVADRMQQILDSAGVPNGVLAGNHDVRHTQYDYTYYLKYFSKIRYEGKEWYGGTINNNINHYDLITVGGYNFLVLYLSYGSETDEQTVAWANAVLKAHSGYNAIIATHEYLLASGVWSSAKAKEIWEKIAVPNDNVKIILCGHNEGTSNRLRQVEGTDRTVLEILHDYQFAEINEGPNHIENGYPCDGEGFFRLIKFNNMGQLIMSTYSANYDLDNYFSPYEESFVYNLDLNRDNRSITTTFFAVGFDAEETKTMEGFDGVYVKDNKGNISSIVLASRENYAYPYPVTGEKPQYITDTTVVESIWYSNISPTLFNTAAPFNPAGKTADVISSLLPTKSESIRKTSGSVDYKAEVTEDGKVSLTFTGTDTTWISVTSPTERINLYENPYIFFSVSAISSVKWNISINTTQRSIYFSHNLFEQFGYPDYGSTSDIRGPWHGIIDLSGYVKDGETVTSIYLVNASRNEELTFDYLFVGKPTGVYVDFKVDDSTIKRVFTQTGNEITPPPSPYINGWVFDGWYYENGEKAVFPLKPTENIILEAVFTQQSLEANCVYYNTEADIITDGRNPDESSLESGDDISGNTSGKKGSPLPYIAVGTSIVIFIGVLLFVRNKKKEK